MDFRPVVPESPISMQHAPRPVLYDNNVKEVSRAACGRCRRLKTKCIVDPDSVGRCRRCIAADAECISAVSSKRPAKRKENDRVADLEATVERLQNTLEQLRQSAIVPRNASNPSSPPSSSSRSISLPAGKSSESAASSINWPRSSNIGTMPSPISTRSTELSNDTEGLDELVRSNIMTHEDMIGLFESIRHSMSTGIRIPPTMTFWDMYRSRPILLQMLITIGSSGNQTLFPILLERIKNRLLFEYFVNNTRRIELVQSFVLNCEYCPPGDFSTFWVSHSYAPLATEVALDIGMYGPIRDPKLQADVLDPYEYERTVMWLFATHTGMLCATRRQPRRVLWTDYHDVCRSKLLESDAYNREIAYMTDLARMQVELFDNWSRVKTAAILHSYDQRIRKIESNFPFGSQRIAILMSFLRSSLHQLYIRAAIDDPLEETQILIAKEVCKEEALRVLSVVQSIGMKGELVSGYPSYVIVKPIGALINLCKMYSFTKMPHDDWLYDFAKRLDRVMTEQAGRGQNLARFLAGKAIGIVRWWASRPKVHMDEAPFSVLQEALKEGDEVDPASPCSDFDFQMFVELFNIDPNSDLGREM